MMLSAAKWLLDCNGCYRAPGMVYERLTSQALIHHARPGRTRSPAACAACGQLISLLARALEQALVVRHERVCKAHDLEAVAIAGEPELPVIAHLAPARPACRLVHGSVGARYPAA